MRPSKLAKISPMKMTDSDVDLVSDSQCRLAA